MPEQIRMANIVNAIRILAVLIFMAGVAGIVYVLADARSLTGSQIVSVLLTVGTPVVIATSVLAVGSILIDLIARGLDSLRGEELFGRDDEEEGGDD